MKKISLIIFAVLCTGLSLVKAQYKLPAYEKFKLSNGLTVYLMEKHEVPVISLSAIFPAGAIYDGSKAGLASITANTLMTGSVNLPKAKLDEELDFMAANIDMFSSKEFSGLRSKFASKYKNRVLDIIKNILLNPAFDKSEFEKEKSRTLVNLEQAKESPRAVIASYFDKAVYGNHVYGNVVSGTTSSVKGISIDDVKRFYNENYYPEGSAIAVVGDFKTPEMKKMISELFSSWKKGTSKHSNAASNPISYPTEANVVLVNKDDARETTFYIGAPGINRNNPDYVAISVLNTYFGGRFTSLLNDELRVNSGLTYGARSVFSPLKNGGTFYISSFTANKTTAEALDLAIQVLQKFHAGGITEENLASAKNYIKGQFPPSYETAGQLANLLTQMYWYDFNESFINNFEKNVDELTVDKAKNIIHKYFPSDKLQFVLIGKADEINMIAEKFGKVKMMDIKNDIP